MPSYTRGDPEDIAILNGVISMFHDRLVRNGVTIGLWYAHKEKDGESAVKVHGEPAHACARIIPYLERRNGAPDGEITVDMATWNTLDSAEKAALLDREAIRFLPALDKERNLKTDRLGRPVLKIRRPDVRIDWFYEVANRHKEKSFEMKQARELAELCTARCSQLRFAFEDGFRVCDENGVVTEDEMVEADSVA